MSSTKPKDNSGNWNGFRSLRLEYKGIVKIYQNDSKHTLYLSLKFYIALNVLVS